MRTADAVDVRPKCNDCTNKDVPLYEAPCFECTSPEHGMPSLRHYQHDTTVSATPAQDIEALMAGTKAYWRSTLGPAVILVLLLLAYGVAS